ncbi:MAG: SCO family protein [Verrucomicrobiales bacterium]
MTAPPRRSHSHGSIAVRLCMTPPTPTDAPPPAQDPQPPRPRLPWFHLVFLSLLVLTGLAAALLMWLSNHPSRGRQQPGLVQSPPPDLPVYAAIRQALSAPERTGQTVTTTSLRGKVWVLGYTYTRCPRGCLGVINTMLKLRDEFGTNPHFHQVSIAVDPAHDAPEVLENFAEAAGIQANDHWWFLSGEAAPLREFVTHQIGFAQTVDVPPVDRLSEFDLFAHDLRLALVDGHGRIRGYYEVQNEDAPTAAFHIERLRNDIRRLLTEAPGETE